MKLDSIGETIATRKFTILGEPDKELRVSLGKPQPDTEGIGYYCPFEIVGLGFAKVKYAKGVDAFQAIQGAMILIGADLDYMIETMGPRLRWEGDDQGGLGFSSR